MNHLVATLGIRWVEAVAVAFGLLSVWLTTRQQIASWPTAIINVAMFFFIFWNARLYADAVLQLLYLSLSAYGWWAWLHGGANHSRLRVTRATRRLWLIGVPAVLAAGVAIGFMLNRHTDSPLPYFDAMLTSASIGAQWMMTRKILENWVVWIGVNLVYVPVLYVRDLRFTALQYTVFALLAVSGYRNWRRSWAASQLATS